MTSRAIGAVQTMGRLLYPERCMHCGRFDPTAWCPSCRSDVAVISPPWCDVCGDMGHDGICERCRSCPPNFDRARSGIFYSSSVRSIMRRYKYEGCRRLVEHLTPFLELLLEAEVERGAEIVTAVPSQAIRLWRRGFNPAELLARRAGEAAGLTVVFGPLRRSWWGRPQVGLGGERRVANVRGRFSCSLGSVFENRNVVLVDDIFTTGSTSSEAALALRNAGARSIVALTVARA